MKHTSHPVWKRWTNFRNCCNNPKNYHYKYYGARGISYDPSWDDFEVFANWLEITIGLPPFPGAVLERIDNNGNFEPGNLYWATEQQNSRNRRSNMLITINRTTKPLCEWAEIYGIRARTVWSRISDYGLTPEEALTKPVRSRRKS